MKRIIRIEVRFEDGRERGQRATPATSQAETAAKVAGKRAAAGVIESFPGLTVTETSSSSTFEGFEDLE